LVVPYLIQELEEYSVISTTAFTTSVAMQFFKCKGHEFSFTLVKFSPKKITHDSIVKCSLAPELLKAVGHPGVLLPVTYEILSIAQVPSTKK
jgi:hypothetical protein